MYTYIYHLGTFAGAIRQHIVVFAVEALKGYTLCPYSINSGAFLYSADSKQMLSQHAITSR